MKIDPTSKTLPPAPVVDERTRPQKPAAEQPGPTPGTSVQLSSLSSQLRDIESGMGTDKAVDSKRVAEIKKAIDDGSFKVNSSTVADRLLESTRDFLRAQKQ